MRVTSALLLVGSVLLQRCAAGVVTRQNSDAQVSAHYKQTGQCFGYINVGEDIAGYGAKLCVPWCQDQAKKNNTEYKGAECDSIHDKSKIDKSLIYKDESGHEWVPGKCVCSSTAIALGQIIGGIVVQGLAKLDKVLCAVFLNAANLIIQGAAEFIPGGAEVNTIIKGTRAIAKAGAKTSAYFGDWIGPACGVPDFPTLSLDSIFTTMAGLPDNYGLPGGPGPKAGKPPAKAASKPAATTAKTAAKPTKTPVKTNPTKSGKPKN